MKALFLLMAVLFLFTACTGRAANSTRTAVPSQTGHALGSTAEVLRTLSPEESSTAPMEETIVLCINGTIADVQWEENEATDELLSYVQNESIVVHTTIYGGFEQVGRLPQNFPRNDVPMTTEPGDVVLYSGNQLVIFFGSNSWSYTKLGHINLPAEKLTELLNRNEAAVEIRPQYQFDR